jgi:predicted RNA-binding Zn-ribbon protein involved in translation (DUF1610 family)
VTSRFDRVRPRPPRASTAPQSIIDTPRDAEGKRALFSSGAEGAAPAGGSVSVECSSCGETTVLSPAQAVRAALPSLHLGFAVGRRGASTTLGLTRRPYPSWMRCPACGRRTWVRVTLQV